MATQGGKPFVAGGGHQGGGHQGGGHQGGDHPGGDGHQCVGYLLHGDPSIAGTSHEGNQGADVRHIYDKAHALHLTSIAKHKITSLNFSTKIPPAAQARCP